MHRHSPPLNKTLAAAPLSPSGIDRSSYPLLAAPRWEGVGTSDIRLVRVWSISNVVLVAMVTLHGRRIRFSHLLICLVGDFTGDIEEGRKSSSRCFYGVVDLISSTCVAGFVPSYTDLLKSSMATT
jgi:hypothetical protein